MVKKIEKTDLIGTNKLLNVIATKNKTIHIFTIISIGKSIFKKK